MDLQCNSKVKRDYDNRGVQILVYHNSLRPNLN